MSVKGESRHSFIDPKVLARFKEMSQEFGIDDQQRQRIVDEMGPIMAERQAAMLTEARAGWVEQIKADSEFNDSRGFDANLTTARSVLKTFGSNELSELLNESGLGDHPAMVKFALRVGRRLEE